MEFNDTLPHEDDVLWVCLFHSTELIHYLPISVNTFCFELRDDLVHHEMSCHLICLHHEDYILLGFKSRSWFQVQSSLSFTIVWDSVIFAKELSNCAWTVGLHHIKVVLRHFDFLHHLFSLLIYFIYWLEGFLQSLYFKYLLYCPQVKNLDRILVLL